MKYSTTIFLFCLISSITYNSQTQENSIAIKMNTAAQSDSSENRIQFKDHLGNPVLEIVEETNGASIKLSSLQSINNPLNKLYNISDVLYWGNIPLSLSSAGWLLNNNNVVLSNLNSNVGLGTDNPQYKLHLNDGKVYVEGFEDWFPGVTVKNTIGRSVFRLEGTLSENNYNSAEIILSDLSNGTSWRILNSSTNTFSFLYYSAGTGFVAPFKVELGSPTNSLTINSQGNVGVGVLSNDYKFAVAGGIIAEEVVVKLQSNWPDYVFEDDYELPSIKETEKFIITNKHLPGVPSAEEIKEEGVALAEMQSILLKKIEELTLHTIRQEKQIEKLQNKISLLIQKEGR